MMLCVIAMVTACAAESSGRSSVVTQPTSSNGDVGTSVADVEEPTTTSSAPVYVLQAGDTPSGVAERFGLSLEELDEYNAGLRAYQRFIVGAVIWVGAPPTSVPQEPPTEFKPTADLAALTFTGAVVADGSIVSGDQLAMFGRVYPQLNNADATVCHLVDDDVTTEAAEGLRGTLGFVGFDLCTTASGPTLGLAADERSATGFDVNGIEVAVLSYAAGTAGVPDTDEILGDAARVRDAGADVVAVVIDWGAVQSVQPSEAERAAVAEITADGAVDLVVGQASLLRPVEEINGVWVVWGLGGFVTSGADGGGWPAQAEDAAILTVRFNRDFNGTIGGSNPSLVATWCDRAGGHVVRLLADMGDATLTPDVRVALVRSAARSSATLGDLLQA